MRELVGTLLTVVVVGGVLSVAMMRPEHVDVPVALPPGVMPQAGDDDGGEPGPEPGDTAPEIAGIDQDGKVFRLSQYKGKVVMLDFWVSWCGPCAKLVPHSREIVDRNKGRPFALLGVNGDAREDDAREAIKRDEMTWPNCLDGQDGAALRDWEIDAYPTIYLIDAKGIVRYKWVGVPPTKKLDRAIDTLLKELEDNPAK
jgi:peroxiredoxin